jgi:Domain of unknown function (DUF4403)
MIKPLIIAGLVAFFPLSQEIAKAQRVIPLTDPPPREIEVAPVPPKLDPSAIEMNAAISFKDTFSNVENVVVRDAGNPRLWLTSGNAGIKFRYWRDPLKFELREDTATMVWDAKYWIKTEKGFAKPPIFSWLSKILTRRGCGSNRTPQHYIFEVNSRFGIKDGWKLSASNSFRACRTDYCGLTFERELALKKVTAVLEPSLNSASAILSRGLQSVDFQPIARRAWNSIVSPVKLDDKSWLAFDPYGVRIGRVAGSEDSINTTLSLISTPRLVNADPATPTNPFPTSPSTSDASGFHVNTEGSMTLEDAADDLEDKLVGRPYTLNDNLAQITAIALTAQNQNVSLKIRLTGSLRGTLYFQGTIRTEPEAKALTVVNIHLTEPSQGALNGIDGIWLNTTPLLGEIGEASKWNLLPLMDAVVGQLEKSLNRSLNEQSTFTFVFERSNLQPVYGAKEIFRLPMDIHGKAALALKE